MESSINSLDSQLEEKVKDSFKLISSRLKEFDDFKNETNQISDNTKDTEKNLIELRVLVTSHIKSVEEVNTSINQKSGVISKLETELAILKENNALDKKLLNLEGSIIPNISQTISNLNSQQTECISKLTTQLIRVRNNVKLLNKKFRKQFNKDQKLTSNFSEKPILIQSEIDPSHDERNQEINAENETNNANIVEIKDSDNFDKRLMKTEFIVNEISNQLNLNSMLISKLNHEFYPFMLRVSKVVREKHQISAMLVLNENEYVVGYAKGLIQVRNKMSHEILDEKKEHTKIVMALILAGNGRLISGSDDCTIKVWSLNPLNLIKSYHKHSGEIACLLTLEGDMFASGSVDTFIMIWSTSKNKEIIILKGHTNTVCGLVSLSSSTILSVSYDCTIRIWLTNLSSCIDIIEDTVPLTCVCLIDEDQVAVGSSKKLIHLWNIKTKEKIFCFKEHKDLIWRIIKIKENFLVSCSRDKSIKIWDCKLKQHIRTLDGHLGQVLQIVSFNDNQLLSCSQDKTLRLWG